MRFLICLATLLALAMPARAQVASNPGYPPGAIAVTNSSGNVAAGVATATLPASPSRLTFLCQVVVTAGGASAAATVTGTITNLNGGTVSFNYSASVGIDAPSPPLVIPLSPCQPANNVNTAIAASIPSLGAGNAHTTITAYGYQANAL